MLLWMMNLLIFIINYNALFKKKKKKREYGCIHRPPYSSELNLLEQYCFGVKFRLQHIQFGDREDLHTRITEA
jgi:hypothetical protein